MTRSNWAKRRQIYYGTGVAVFLLSIIIPTLYFTLHKEPTCFDGKRNQGEITVDEGGPCKLLDQQTQEKLNVLWARSFPIREGVYSSVAYVENPNKKAGIDLMTYQFKLYDQQGVLIAERFGRVPILPGRIVPIIETNISVGTREIVRTFFQLLDEEVWVDMQDPTKELEISNEVLSGETTKPRVDAKIKNVGVGDRSQVVLVATLFDTAGNAFAASRTFVESIKAGEERQIVFTWPSAFALPVSRVDVLPIMAPSSN